ncbi:MAG: hypothetical protein U1E40_09165 [Amaricoccus sp.]
MARWRGATPRGAARTFAAGRSAISAKPPSITSPTKPRRSQIWPRPARQAAQSPQTTRLSTATGSPTATWRTPAPMAAISPASSWPAIDGARVIHWPVA